MCFSDDCFKQGYQLIKNNYLYWLPRGFPGSSACKESALNAENSSSIPGSRRCAGEGISYPHQYSWASLVAQTVKNPPAMWETWFPSQSWEDTLEELMATHSNILAWRILWTEELGSPWGRKELDVTKRLSTHTHWLPKLCWTWNRIICIIFSPFKDEENSVQRVK